MASAISHPSPSGRLNQTSESFPQRTFLRILEITATSYGLLPTVPTAQRRRLVCPRAEHATVRIVSPRQFV